MPSLARKALMVTRTSVLVVVIVLVILVGFVRFTTPVLNGFRSDVETELSALVGYQVSVDNISLSWQKINPEVLLEGLRLIDQESKNEIVRFKRAWVEIAILESLRNLALKPRGIMVDGAALYLVRHADRTIAIEGFNVKPENADSGNQAMAGMILSYPYLGLKNSSIHWKDEYRHREFSFSNIDIQLHNSDTQHDLKGAISFPDSVGQSLAFSMSIEGDVLNSRNWQGRVKAKAAGLNIKTILDEWGGEYINLDKGMLDFELDGNIEQARINKITGKAGLYSATLHQHESTENRIADMELGRINWSREQDNWELEIGKLVFAEADKKSEPGHFKLDVEYKEDVPHVAVELDRIESGHLANVVLISASLPDKWRNAFYAMQPQGILKKINGRFALTSNGVEQLEVSAGFTDISLHPWEKIPGVTQLSGAIVHEQDKGALVLNTEHDEASLYVPAVFRSPWPMKELSGEIKWMHKDNAWEIASQKMELIGKDLEMELNALVRIEPGTSPYIDISASFENGNAEHVSPYLPVVIMPEKVVKWLDHSIVSGHVTTGTAVFRGHVKDFPFTNNNGEFKVEFGIENALLDYIQGWPRIDQIEANVVFSANHMDIDVVSGKIFDANIEQTKVSIPALGAHDTLLAIKGKVSSTTRDGINFLKQSPLQKKFGNFLPEQEVQGDCNINLDMGIHLEEKPNTIAGSVEFKNNTLNGKYGLKVEKINGVLKFSEHGVGESHIKGRFLGKDIIARIYTEQLKDSAHSYTTLDINGSLDIANLMQSHDWPWLIYFSGNTDWNAKLQLSPDWGAGKGKSIMHIESELSGIDINLPSPLAKKQDELKTLEVGIEFSEQETRKVSLLYGKDISGIFEIADHDGKTALTRGGIHLGSEGIELPEQAAFRVSGDLANIDIDNWATFFKSQKLWKPESSGLSLVLEANHLHIERKSVEVDKQETSQTTLDPRDVPPMHIRAKRFTYGKAELGQLNMDVAKVQDGLHFRNITLNSSLVKATGTGRWLLIDGKHISSMDMKFEHQNFGHLLGELDYTSEFRGSATKLELNSNWDGSPYDWSLSKLVGTLKVNMGKGRIKDVDPGGMGRVFGLLSLHTIPRRLALDFSDVFKKGYTFDSIKGDFTLDKGNAYTNNLVIDAPSGKIELAGRTGLVDEDYDQIMTFTPTLSGSFAVAGAVAGGPIGAALAVVAEKLFRKQISHVSQYQYTVTGPWSEPVVTKLKKETPEPEPEPEQKTATPDAN